MADDGKMLVVQRKQEHEDFPSALPKLLRRGSWVEWGKATDTPIET
jgi:hypothetical protein